MRLNTIVFEEFYNNPIEVRNKVLQQDFYPPFYLDNIPRTEALDSDLVYWVSQIGYFSGKRTINVKVNMPELQEYTEDKIKKICNFPFKIDVHNYFTYQTIHDSGTTSIHQDTEPIMAGVIYLAPTPVLGSGTYFYRHKESNWTGLNSDEYPALAFEDMHPFHRTEQDQTKFEEFGYIENMWNRMILYDSDLLHKPGKYFGTDLQTGRLTQTFFVYKIGE